MVRNITQKLNDNKADYEKELLAKDLEISQLKEKLSSLTVDRLDD